MPWYRLSSLENQEFECTMDFKDGTIGILNGVRVAKKDFRKITIKKEVAMKNLFVAQQGVRGCNLKVEKKGCVTIRFADGNNFPYTVIEVDNYKGIGLNYHQRDEPLVIIHNFPDCGSDPVFTGTHQQLVEKVTYNPQSLPETLFQISYEMGFQSSTREIPWLI